MSRYRHISVIDEIIIHCADTPNGRWQSIEDIDRWHGERQPPFQRDPKLMTYQAPRLSHIGYHFVIYTTGGVISGRGLNETGAHAAGRNTRGIGICLIGRDKYTLDQWTTLKGNVLGLKDRFPHARVLGHRDVNAGKTCPGFDVAAWLAGGMEPLAGHIFTEDEGDG